MLIDWWAKLKATLIHLALSLVLALLSAGLVYFVWYPFPYRDLLWGQGIYVWLICVDAVLGPILTFVLFNPRKKTLERILDFSVIGVLQVGALIYGVWALAQARPLYVVFEFEKFHVVPEYLVPDHSMQHAPPHLKSKPWGRPELLSIRRLPEDEADIAVWEKNINFGGPPLAAQPKLWQDYALAANRVSEVGVSFDDLLRSHPGHTAELIAIQQNSKLPRSQLIGVPIFSEKGEGVLLLSKESLSVVDCLVLRREPSGW